MNENVKLRESQFFLKHLHESREAQQEIFQFYLSAFINAGRSVLQYAMDENQFGSRSNRRWKTPAAKTWFDKWAKNTIIKGFKQNRDQNIHFEPVEADHQSAMMMGGCGTLKTKPQKAGSSTLEVEYYTPPGTIGPAVKMFIRFSRWRKTEDVETLSQKYVDLLESFIIDGVQQGFLKNP
jgi:hypothetical protein